MRRLLAAFIFVLAGCATPGQPITGPKGWVVMMLEPSHTVVLVPANPTPLIRSSRAE